FRRLSKCKAPSRYDHVFPGRLASLELVLFEIGKPLGLVGVDALIAAPALELPGVAFEPECVISACGTRGSLWSMLSYHGGSESDVESDSADHPERADPGDATLLLHNMQDGRAY